MTSLGGAVEGQHAGVTSRLISRINELEAELNVLAAELRKPDEEVFTLQLLHASDMDGSVGALANVENFSAILDGFPAAVPQQHFPSKLRGQLRSGAAQLRRR